MASADRTMIVKPWDHITIELRMMAGWRYRWSLGFWLIRMGSRLIAHRVTCSVKGADDVEPPPASAGSGLERLSIAASQAEHRDRTHHED